MSTFSQKLKLIMDAKRITPTELAKKIPCSKATVYAWLAGTKMPERKLFALLDILEVSKESLMSDVTDSVESIKSYYDRDCPIPPDMVIIHETKLSRAGEGEQTWEIVDGSDSCWYKRSYFLDNGHDPDHCRRSMVIGDSMEPLLFDGDVVLWTEEENPKDVDIQDGKVYVLGVHGSLRVKRLSRLIDGTVVVRSDNPAYPEERFSLAEQTNIRIYGRVIQATKNRAFL